MNYQPIPAEQQNTSVSERIRARLTASGTRFHANDNIAAFIEPGEMDQLLDEVSARMQGVLESLVIDTASDHNTQGTARRVAKMYLQEIFGGRYTPPPPVTEFPNAAHLNELMIIGPYARLAAWVMNRPQIQEEAVVQLAELLQEKMQPDGLAVIMEAEHFCMHWRGVKDTDALMVNSVMHGSFLKDPALRREF
eukprot:gene20535-20450_t